MKTIQKFIIVVIVLLVCIIALLLYYYKNHLSDLEIAIQQYNDGKYKQAFNAFMPLAKKGNAKAQFYLGSMFYFGRGIDKNDFKAYTFFSLAANQHLPEAYNNMATCFFNGIGVAKDSQKGLTYLQMASLQGVPVALLRLGALYYNGDDVEKNHQLALCCFQQAAEKNNPQAQCMLGRMYLKGEGVTENLDKGYELMHIAANNGALDAQMYISFYYLQMNKMDLAKKWLSILKKRGKMSEATIQKFLEFGKLLQKDEAQADLYFDNIEKFEKLRPIPMMDSLNSNPYSKPYKEVLSQNLKDTPQPHSSATNNTTDKKDGADKH